MRTVGEILKVKRLERKLAFEEIEKATKIRAKYLEAIERNDFGKIPGGAPIAKGFIKNYAQFLELAPADILAVFRRDFRESKTGEIIPHGYYEPLNKPKLAWNPRLTMIFGVVVLLVVLFGYLFSQVFIFLSVPRLIVNEPVNGKSLKFSEIWVQGKSDTDATVLVNGELVVLDKEGNFKAQVSLFPGENKIKIEAISRRGKKATVLRQVKYEPL